ncbi:MAG TPA: alpha-L-rhamnosidase C-terminal domain-containing protein, partial [Bacilli bacterium]
GGYVSNNRSMEFLDAYQLKDPLTPISAFWLAECYSKYGKHEQAWHVISTVWGKMLSEDATTFWESVVLSPQSDYHDSQTTYTSYESYRMSLCHSWASTPPQWISRYVLGVGPLEPGYERISFSPNAIGGLTQCSGTISTPLGPINVEWKLREDGTMDAKIDMPKAVTQQVS